METRARAMRNLLLLLLAARLVASVLSPAGQGWDFAQYYRTGSRAWNGEWDQLYRVDAAEMERFREMIGEPGAGGAPPGERADELVPSGRLGHIGVPLSALLLAPLGALPPRSALFAFKLAGALCFAATWWLLLPSFRRRAAPRIGERWAEALYLGLCLLFEPFWFVFTAGGQSTPFNLLMLALFFRCFVDGRTALAALAFAFGLLLKPFFLLSALILLLARRWRLLAYLAALGALGGAVSLAVFGLGPHLEWIEVLRASAAGMAEPWWNNTAVLGGLYTLWSVGGGGGLDPAGEPHGWIRWLAAGYKIGVVILFAYFLRRPAAPATGAAGRRRQVALLAVLFPLLFSNIVWPHYLSFLFLPLLFLLFPGASDRAPAMLAWAVFASTLAIRGRFVQRALLSALEPVPWLQGAAAAFAGSVTLLLVLAFVLVYRNRLGTMLAAEGPGA